MENYELYIENPCQYNKLTGCFIKGHIPFNKGLPMIQWMDGRKIRRVKKNLEIGRKLGNHNLPITNRKPVIGIKDGKLYSFNSATDAANILKSKGIKVNRRNICAVCHQEIIKVGNYNYIRKKAGGFQWFFTNEIEKYKNLIYKI